MSVSCATSNCRGAGVACGAVCGLFDMHVVYYNDLALFRRGWTLSIVRFTPRAVALSYF